MSYNIAPLSVWRLDIRWGMGNRRRVEILGHMGNSIGMTKDVRNNTQTAINAHLKAFINLIISDSII
jgi:hypothetical protein